MADLNHEVEDKFEQASGKVKEAAGSLTGDKDLEAEGKVDQASGKASEVLHDAGDKAKDIAEEAKAGLSAVADKVKDVFNKD